MEIKVVRSLWAALLLQILLDEVVFGCSKRSWKERVGFLSAPPEANAIYAEQTVSHILKSREMQMTQMGSPGATAAPPASLASLHG